MAKVKKWQGEVMTEQAEQKSESELIIEELEKFSSEHEVSEDVEETPKKEETTKEEPKEEDSNVEQADKTGDEKPEKPDGDTSSEDIVKDGDKKAKPEEKAEDAIKEKEPEKPEGDKKPANEAFARMRHKEKTLASQVQELQEQLESLKNGAEQKPQAPQRPPADLLFMHLVRAENGELTEAETAALGGPQDVIAANIDAVISEELGSSDILEIQNMAKNGRFGAQSESILEKAKSYLPAVLAREREVDSAQRNQQENANKIMETYRTEIEKAADDFPELSADKEDVAKLIDDWEKEYIGEVDGLIVKRPGRLPQELAQYLMLHPYERARIIATELKGGSVIMKELEQHKEKIKKLEDKLKLADSPESGSPSGAVKSKEVETSADIKRQLEELSAQRSE